MDIYLKRGFTPSLLLLHNTSTTLTPLRKPLRMRGVKGLPGHKKVTQCLRSGNAAYTPRLRGSFT